MSLSVRARAELARRARLANARVIVLTLDGQGWRYRGEPVNVDTADRLRRSAGTTIVIRREPAPLPRLQTPSSEMGVR